ncbi:MAG: hypothetical protein O2868_20280 [Proteobacteria bacterium]|nr:hypothetical protein [Pseudomonadota bacterium]
MTTTHPIRGRTNLLTPVSYRVRWANVRYVDDSYVVNQPAFFIERKTRLAKRVGLETSGLKGIHSSELAPDAAALVTLWQFMIGNPDYSIIRGDEECCHNAKLLVSDDGHYVPIIYDFDGTGLVGAEYARPPVRVPIKDVSERVYLGFCRHNDHLIQVRKLLLERREGIHALFSDDPMLGARARSEAVRYLKKSYQFLGRDGSFKRQVLDACRS